MDTLGVQAMSDQYERLMAAVETYAFWLHEQPSGQMGIARQQAEIFSKAAATRRAVLLEARILEASARVAAYDDLSCDELGGDWRPRSERPCFAQVFDDVEDVRCDACGTLVEAQAELAALIQQREEEGAATT